MSHTLSTRTDPKCFPGNYCRELKTFRPGTEVYVQVNYTDLRYVIFAHYDDAVMCRRLDDVASDKSIIDFFSPDALGEVDMGG